MHIYAQMQVLQDDKKRKFNICMSNILPHSNLTLNGFVKTPCSEMADDVNAVRSNIFEMEIVFKPISVHFRWSWE